MEKDCEKQSFFVLVRKKNKIAQINAIRSKREYRYRTISFQRPANISCATASSSQGENTKKSNYYEELKKTRLAPSF
jgi:hypothetical protein